MFPRLDVSKLVKDAIAASPGPISTTEIAIHVMTVPPKRPSVSWTAPQLIPVADVTRQSLTTVIETEVIG